MNLIVRIKSALKAFQESNPQVDTAESGEKSTYASSYYDKSFLRPYNPDELVQKKGLSIFREMMLDDQVKAVTYMKRLSVLSTVGEFGVDPDDPQGEEKADFCNYVFNNIKGSFNRALFKILTSYQYGFSISEKIFSRYETGKYKGKIGIKAIKTRPPESFEINTDDYGNIKYVKQYQAISSPKLDPKYLIIHTYNEEFDGNYYGQSDLASAYTAWWNKKFNRKFRNIRNERFGMPLAVGYYPPGAGKKEKAALLNMVQNLQSKAAGILPKMDSDDEIIKFIESKLGGGKTDVYGIAINYEDRSIARALLMPDMLGFSEQKSGSRALGETQYDLYLNIINFLRTDIETELVFEQITKQLVNINFVSNGMYPIWKFKPLTEEDRQAIVSVFSNAVQKGVIQPTVGDRKHTRQLLGYPAESEENAEKIDDENKGGEFSEHARRGYNKLEKQMDFAEIKDTLGSREEETIEKINGEMEKVRDGLIEEIATVKPTENNDINYIKLLEIDFLGIEPILATALSDIYNAGRKKAAAFISEKDFQAMTALDLPPEKAMEWFATQSSFAVSGIGAETAGKVRQRLLTGLSQGQSTKEVIGEVQKIFNPYVVGEVAANLAENPYGIETIVRTNFTKAYNEGINQEVKQSNLVEKIRYSAVLDDRTTEYCMSMDEKVFMKGDADFKSPPAHFNCRSIIIPITKSISKEYPLSDTDPKEPRKGIIRGEGF